MTKTELLVVVMLLAACEQHPLPTSGMSLLPAGSQVDEVSPDTGLPDRAILDLEARIDQLEWQADPALLAAALEDPDFDVREAAIERVAEFPVALRLQLLTNQLRHPEAEVREEALLALAGKPPYQPDVQYWLRVMQNDSDPEVRQTASELWQDQPERPEIGSAALQQERERP